MTSSVMLLCAGWPTVVEERFAISWWWCNVTVLHGKGCLGKKYTFNSSVHVNMIGTGWYILVNNIVDIRRNYIIQIYPIYHDILKRDKYLVSCSASCHYLNYWWIIFNRSHGNKFNRHFNQDAVNLMQKNQLKIYATKWRSFSLGLNVLITQSTYSAVPNIPLVFKKDRLLHIDHIMRPLENGRCVADEI